MKEYDFYLDSTTTHATIKYLYKYPLVAYPYTDLVETNRRTQSEQEYYSTRVSSTRTVNSTSLSIMLGPHREWIGKKPALPDR